MPLEIRPLEARDFERGFMETLGSLAPVDLLFDEAEAIWKARSAIGIHTIVAELEDRIIGTASLLVEKKFIHRGGLVGHIEDVAVHSDYWRRGIGTQLVDRLTALAVSLKCYKVILNCHEHLVPFYGRIGYRKYDTGCRLNAGDYVPLGEKSMDS
jgi:glucosamine-phosphate N-acetyltransferase